MDFTTSFQSQDSENNFCHYLQKHGTKKELDGVIYLLEQNNKQDPFILQTILTKKFPNKLWEIPTKELCTGLLKLFKYLGIHKINELGAGMAMLSAQLSYHTKQIPYELEINAYSKKGCTFLYDNNFTYYPVTDAKFEDHVDPSPIIISWLYPRFCDELFDMILRNKNEYVFLIGEHTTKNHEGSCQTNSFHSKMLENGYQCYIIPFKQVCQMDYILADDYKDEIGKYSRSCTVMYTKKEFDYANLSKIVGKSNLGTYLELTPGYIVQDVTLALESQLNMFNHHHI